MGLQLCFVFANDLRWCNVRHSSLTDYHRSAITIEGAIVGQIVKLNPHLAVDIFAVADFREEVVVEEEQVRVLGVREEVDQEIVAARVIMG